MQVIPRPGRDLHTPEYDPIAFRIAVYAIVLAIPCGKVISYKGVAALAGYPAHARMAGRILAAVAPAEKLPCHRVVSASGRTAPTWAAQRELLEAEGVVFRRSGCVNMEVCRWRFEEE